MTTGTITRYFEERLSRMGYSFNGDSDICWSLGYCQGDGMDFAGRVSREGVIALYSRLVAPISEARNERLWNALCDGAVSVEISRISSHYHHFNTMSVEVEWDADDLRATYGFTARQLARLDDFAAAVEEDVRSTSKTLEKEGYAILEACSPMWFRLSKHWKDGYLGDHRSTCTRTFRRGDFSVEVSMIQNDHLDGYESGDLEADHQDMLDMVAGKNVSYDLRLRILEDGNTVHEEWAHGVTDRRDQICPMAIARELLIGARRILADKATRLSQFAGAARMAEIGARISHQAV